MKKNINNKFNQNSIVHKKYIVDYDKKTGLPNYRSIKIVSTNKKVIVYNEKDEKIGEAGVIRESDFDFDALVNMAMETSGSKIEVA